MYLAESSSWVVAFTSNEHRHPMEQLHWSHPSPPLCNSLRGDSPIEQLLFLVYRHFAARQMLLQLIRGSVSLDSWICSPGAHTSTPAFLNMGAPSWGAARVTLLHGVREGQATNLSRSWELEAGNQKLGTLILCETPDILGMDSLMPRTQVSPFLSLYSAPETAAGASRSGRLVCGQPGPLEPEAISMPLSGWPFLLH